MVNSLIIFYIILCMILHRFESIYERFGFSIRYYRTSDSTGSIWLEQWTSEAKPHRFDLRSDLNNYDPCLRRCRFLDFFPSPKKTSWLLVIHNACYCSTINCVWARVGPEIDSEVDEARLPAQWGPAIGSRGRTAHACNAHPRSRHGIYLSSFYFRSCHQYIASYLVQKYIASYFPVLCSAQCAPLMICSKASSMWK